MAIFTVREAKASLCNLIERASAGEETVIARGDEPLVRLQPVAAGRPVFGAVRGKARKGETFFEPLPRDGIGAWER